MTKCGVAKTGDLPQRELCEPGTREECMASDPWGRAHRPEQSVSGPCAKSGSLARHTMIRSFPKLGCGVAEGMGTGIVDSEAIKLFRGEGKNGESGGVGGTAPHKPHFHPLPHVCQHHCYPRRTNCRSRVWFFLCEHHIQRIHAVRISSSCRLLVEGEARRTSEVHHF